MDDKKVVLFRLISKALNLNIEILIQAYRELEQVIESPRFALVPLALLWYCFDYSLSLVVNKWKEKTTTTTQFID